MKTILIFGAFMGLATILSAQINPAITSNLDTISIEGTKKFYMARQVRSFQDMADIIIPQGDLEATRHLLASRKLKTIGFISLFASALLAGYVNSRSNATNFSFESIAVPGYVASYSCIIIGGTRKNLAIRRFNHVAKSRLIQ